MDGRLHHQISILAAVKQTTILEEVNTAAKDKGLALSFDAIKALARKLMEEML